MKTREAPIAIGPVRAAVLHPTTTNRKLAPIEQQAYDGPGVRRFRPQPGWSRCAATYASIEATCPRTCRFREHGCYVRTGFTLAMSAQLDRGAAERTPIEVMREEAALLDRFSERGVPQDGGRRGDTGRDLRLHVGGDVTGTRGAEILAAAAHRWRQRGGGAVWTYTHRWRAIERDAFGPISTLASVETAAGARDAQALGYVPALVVHAFPRGHRVFEVRGAEARFVPCPAEAGRMTCVQCRLCLDDEALYRRGLGIAFEAHGGMGQARNPKLRRLPVLQESKV